MLLEVKDPTVLLNSIDLSRTEQGNFTVMVTGGFTNRSAIKPVKQNKKLVGVN